MRMPTPGITMTESNISSKVEAFITAKQLLDSGASVAVGFSGGADSTALLVILASLGYDVSAVHFNHNLRGAESDNDEAQCRLFCEQAKIPFVSVALQVKQGRLDSESIEMAARRMRLEYWKASGNAVVALGHHKDDALETCMLNLCRGGNVSSLSGLKPLRRFGLVQLIRPLLCVTRGEIAAFLKSQGITPPGHDSSNEDESYKRNQVRHELLPVLEKIAGGRQALYRSLENLASDSDVIESAIPQIEQVTPALLREQPDAIRFRMLRDWLINACQAYGTEAVISGNTVDRVFDALQKESDEPVLIDLDNRFFIRMTKDSLALVAKEIPVLTEPVIWDWRKNPELELECVGIRLSAEYVTSPDYSEGGECFDAESLAEVLTVRGRKDGDAMVPFGARSMKKLKKLVSDSRLGYLEKQSLVVIEDPDGGIIWVPGVKRAEQGRVDKGTKMILRLTAIRTK